MCASTRQHVCKSLRIIPESFERRKIQIMISPDHNLIENVWGLIPNEIYGGGKAYFAEGLL